MSKLLQINVDTNMGQVNGQYTATPTPGVYPPPMLAPQFFTLPLDVVGQIADVVKAVTK